MIASNGSFFDFSLFRRTNLYIRHNYLNDHAQYFKLDKINKIKRQAII